MKCIHAHACPFLCPFQPCNAGADEPLVMASDYEKPLGCCQYTVPYFKQHVDDGLSFGLRLILTSESLPVTADKLLIRISPDSFLSMTTDELLIMTSDSCL